MLHAVLIGCVAALAAAAVMTWLDWQLNPNGLFHGRSGTNWLVVRDTASSWFVPLFPLASALALPVTAWRAHRSAAADQR